MPEKPSPFIIRPAQSTDLAGIIAVKESLSIQRAQEPTSKAGFLLGSSPQLYAEMIERVISQVIANKDTSDVEGIGFALDSELLKKTEFWRDRSLAQWQPASILQDLERGKPGYVDQLAILPQTSARHLAPALGLSLLERLFQQNHTHVLATTVLEPVRNLASLKLLQLVHAQVVGEIVEEYDGVGRILSQIHCIKHEDYGLFRSTPIWKRLMAGLNWR